MSDSLAAQVEALSAGDRTNAAHAIRSIATNGKRRDATKAALLLVADMLAAPSAADTPEGGCCHTFPDGMRCTLTSHTTPGLAKLHGIHDFPAPVGSDADTETAGCTWVSEVNGAACVLNVGHSAAHLPAPVPSAERTDVGTDEGLAELVAQEYARHKMQHGSFFNIRCECGYITNTVSEKGEFEQHITDSIAERISDWLAQRDQRIAEAARAEGARAERDELTAALAEAESVYSESPECVPVPLLCPPRAVRAMTERHLLVVTHEPVSAADRAEYDAADTDERRDWDRDRRVINVECAGLDQTCFGWVECMLPHNFTEDEQDEGEATAHGVWHKKFYFGWATEGERCGLYQFPDAWCDAATDLADELGEGRHAIDFEWEDEHTILMHSAATPPTTGEADTKEGR